MQSKYYGSAKITYFDKDAVWQALRQLAARLGSQHPEIARIIVFGSLVRGEAVPGSDVDLLLVLRESDRPFPERAGLYRPSGFPVGLDIFAYTHDEVRRMLADGNWFLKHALEEGVTLLDRDKPSGR